MFEYQSKRHFENTPEPAPKKRRVRPALLLSFKSMLQAAYIMIFASS
jgi:hypothetical protein